jgi:uncharacterized protein YlxW (UPF0749 family)
MNSLKRFIVILPLILITGCSSQVDPISAEELVAEGCKDYRSAAALSKFSEAADIDEKYRNLAQNVSSLQTSMSLIENKSITDNQIKRTLALKVLDNLSTINSFCR